MSTICLRGTWYGFKSPLTCNEKVPLKHPIQGNTLPYSLCIFDIVVCICLSFSFCTWTCNKVLYFLISVVPSMQIILMLLFGLTYLNFACHSAFSYVNHLVSGSICSAAAGVHILASLIMLVHFVALQRNCIDTWCPYKCESTYVHLWYAWVIGVKCIYFVNGFAWLIYILYILMGISCHHCLC